jgi:hypothetical protein
LVKLQITSEQKRALWASSELSYDPMYQETMDLMYHHWMQDCWKGIGWRKEHDLKTQKRVDAERAQMKLEL